MIYSQITAGVGKTRSPVDLMDAIERVIDAKMFARPWPMVWIVAGSSPATLQALLHAHLRIDEAVLVTRIDPRAICGHGAEIVKLQAWVKRMEERANPPAIDM